MRNYTENDVRESSSWDGRLYVHRSDLIDNPLCHHVNGRQQTASGYGRKLSTPHMVRFNGRKHRVYCCCFSNSGTCYIVSKGRNIIIDIS